MLSAITTVHGPSPPSPVSRVTENRDISVVFLTFLGSKAVVVLSGVLGLVNLLFVECTDCETLPVVVVVGKPQVCYAKG